MMDRLAGLAGFAARSKGKRRVRIPVERRERAASHLHAKTVALLELHRRSLQVDRQRIDRPGYQEFRPARALTVPGPQDPLGDFDRPTIGKNIGQSGDKISVRRVRRRGKTTSSGPINSRLSSSAAEV